MPLSFRILFTIALVASESLCHAEGVKTYKLKLERPEVVGNKSRVHVITQFGKSQKMTSGDTVLKENKEELKAEASGVLEILAVSPRGKVQQFKLTLKKFSVQQDAAAPVEPFEAGETIAGALDESGKASFTYDSGPIPAAALKALNELFPLRPDRPNAVADDVVFATEQPRAVGTEWEINKAAALKSAPELPFKLTEDEISGKVKFPAVKQIDGKEHCLIEAEIRMKPTQIKGMPPGFQIEKSEMVIRIESPVPVDEKVTTGEDKMTTRGEFLGTGDTPNGKVRVEFNMWQRRERESENVK